VEKRVSFWIDGKTTKSCKSYLRLNHKGKREWKKTRANKISSKSKWLMGILTNFFICSFPLFLILSLLSVGKKMYTQNIRSMEAQKKFNKFLNPFAAQISLTFLKIAVPLQTAVLCILHIHIINIITPKHSFASTGCCYWLRSPNEPEL
jgi:hypothetical protein